MTQKAPQEKFSHSVRRNKQIIVSPTSVFTEIQTRSKAHSSNIKMHPPKRKTPKMVSVNSRTSKKVLQHREKASTNRPDGQMVKDTAYPCAFCDFSCGNKKDLDLHVEILHKNQHLFSCSFCHYTTDKSHLLSLHILLHNSDMKYSCVLCNLKFSHLNYLRKHLKYHLEEKPSSERKKFACPHCSKEFCRKVNYSLHMLKHSQENIYKCFWCDFTADQLVVLDDHMYSHGTDAGFSCTECHSCFPSLLDHGVHMLINHEEFYSQKISTALISPCTHCDQVFHRFSDLRLHIFEIHAKECSLDLKDKTVKFSVEAVQEKKYLCETCGTFLRTPGALKMHKCKSLDVKMFKCSSCNRSFRNKTLLKSHEYLHTGLKPLVCPECPYRCRRKQYLKRHMLIHSGEKTHLCTVCGQAFLFHDSLKNHMHKHSSEEPLSCSICSFTTSDPNGLTRHMAKHINNFFSCEVCSFTTMREVDLKKHQLTHLPEKSIPCSNCQLKFTSAKDLQAHMLTHVTIDNPINYSCNFCSYSCQVQKDYIRHMQTHSIAKPFACEICDYSSNRRVNLKMHMKRQHKRVLASVVSFTCKLCNFTCERDRDFIKHMRFTHNVDKPFDCPVCPFSTHRQSLLKVHMDTHKPHGFSCSLCSFKCKRRTLLNKHMASKHTDNTPSAPYTDSKIYRCKSCEFTSKHYASLRNHMPIHSSVRFPCDECNYATYSKRNLDSHKKSHIKLKPFKCPFCDYSSARKNNFKIHMVRHIDEKLYYCDKCDFTSKTENELSQHILDSHPGEIEEGISDTSRSIMASLEKMVPEVHDNNDNVPLPGEKFCVTGQDINEQGTLKQTTQIDLTDSHNVVNQDDLEKSSFTEILQKDISTSSQVAESCSVIQNENENSTLKDTTQVDQNNLKEAVFKRAWQESQHKYNLPEGREHQLPVLSKYNTNISVERSTDAKQHLVMNAKNFSINGSSTQQLSVPSCLPMNVHYPSNPSVQSPSSLQPTVTFDYSQKEYITLTPYQHNGYMRNMNETHDMPSTSSFYVSNFTMYPQPNSHVQDHYDSRNQLQMLSQPSETEFMSKTSSNFPHPSSVVDSENIMETDDIQNVPQQCNAHLVTGQQVPGNETGPNSQQVMTHFPQLLTNVQDGKVFTCNFCNFSCVSDQEFKQHVTMHTMFPNQPQLKFACYLCEISFTYSDDLDKHNRECHYEPLAMTQVSNEKNSPVDCHTSLSVQTNKKPDEKRQSYSCSRCAYVCDRPCDFKRHMLSTHGIEKAFSCELCSYSTKREDDLKIHKITHDKGMTRSCSLCDYTCKRSPALRKHMRKHTDVRLFNCNLCDFWCNYEPDLKSHIIKAHEKPKTFICHICRYSCEFAIHFKKHMYSVHSIENAFVCSQCDYSTTLWNNFRAHRLKHTGSKKLNCKICDFSCKRSSSLKNHMAIHFHNKSLKCSKCDYQCEVVERLKVHMRKHTNERPYACKSCHRSYTHSSSLYKHISLVHKNAKRHPCPKCSYTASTSTLLRRHMFVHGVGRRFHCKLCQFGCNHSEVLRNHMLLHDPSITAIPSNSCSIQTSVDNKETNSACKNAQVILESNETKTKQFNCSDCKHTFTSSSNFQKHLMRHKKSQHVNRFLCSICEFSCLRPHELKIHTCFHTGEKLFTCDLCEFASNKPYSLKYHKEKEHRNSNTKSSCKDSGLVQCPICKFSFTKRLYLKYHIQEKHQVSKCISFDQSQTIQDTPVSNHNSAKEEVNIDVNKSSKMPGTPSPAPQSAITQKHTSVKDLSSKQFFCTQCNYSTTRKGNLTTHMQKHGEKNFLCHLCDYVCRRERELNRHLLTHEKNKPLSCTLCSYTCIQSSNLKIHMLKHKGEKPIQCQLCDFRCRQRSTLRDHMTTHSDERRFACHQCDYKAKRAVSLKMHLLTHTSEKPVCCNLCDFTCKHVNALRSHMRSHATDPLHEGI